MWAISITLNLAVSEMVQPYKIVAAFALGISVHGTAIMSRFVVINLLYLE